MSKVISALTGLSSRDSNTQRHLLDHPLLKLLCQMIGLLLWSTPACTSFGVCFVSVYMFVYMCLCLCVSVCVFFCVHINTRSVKSVTGDVSKLYFTPL